MRIPVLGVLGPRVVYWCRCSVAAICSSIGGLLVIGIYYSRFSSAISAIFCLKNTPNNVRERIRTALVVHPINIAVLVAMVVLHERK